ncbi:TPA: fibronectin type III domain-containing protein [Bacillus cereus]|nr:fibronectin type III domain-containing protein [Bacillus cereus]HDR8255456.1 fibronectin type III domain-containing protein [Bacillus cereus]
MRIKKFLVVVPLLLGILFVGDTSAFAQGRDVLSGIPGKTRVSSIYTLTDGNLRSSDDLTGGDVTFTLSSPVRISGFRFTKVGGSSQRMDVYFYHSSGVTKKEYRASDSGYLNSVDLKGVTKVVLQNQSSGDYFTLAEVNLYEYESVPPSNITNLKENITHNSVEFTYKNPTSNFSNLKIYRNGELLDSNVKAEKFTDKGLTPEMEYTYKFISVSPDGLESKGIEKKIQTTKEPLPDEIKDLQEDEITHTYVKFSYKFPKNNFDHVKIYRDDKVIADNVKVEEFTDKGLKGSTEYNYRFVSVSSTGLESNGIVKKVKTDEEPNLNKPFKPSNFDVMPKDGSLVVNLLSQNLGVPIKGYHIFIDGVKVNDSLVTGRSYAVKGLQNGQTYGVQIKAVSKWNIESDLSNVVNGIPKVPVIPEVTFSFGLGALVDGITNWFLGIWPIVAFSIAIPLAFIVAFNTKKLFMR